MEINTGFWRCFFFQQSSQLLKNTDYPYHYEIIFGTDNKVGGYGSQLLFNNFKDNNYLFFAMGHLGPCGFDGSIIIDSEGSLFLKIYSPNEEDFSDYNPEYSTLEYKKVSDNIETDYPIWP